MSSDKEEFCRLDRLLISVAVEGGNQPGPEQVGYLSTRLMQSLPSQIMQNAAS